jgi:thioredoxin
MDSSHHVKDFQSKLNANNRPVVVDFWAPWCAPCRRIEPALHRVEQEYKGQVDLWRINADENPDLLRHLHVYGIPTLLAFQGQAEVTRSTGVASPGAIKSLFEAALQGEAPLAAGIPVAERALRLGAGLFLAGLAAWGGFSGIYLALAVLGGAVAFSAVYDRCPIWQAIAPRASAWLKSISDR